MTPPDAATVAAPTASDPLDALFDGVTDAPETNFDVTAVDQLGSPKAQPAEATIPIVDGEIATPKAEEEADEPDDVGEPYTIGKDGRVRGKDGRWMDKATVEKTEAKPDERIEGAAKSAPFKYRALGETKVFEGAVQHETGDVTIPAAKVGELREALNAREVRSVNDIPTIQRTQQENRTLKAQLDEATKGRTVREAQADAYTKALNAALVEPDEETALAAFFKMRADMPTLLLKAESDHYKRLAESKPTPTVAKPAVAAKPSESSSGLPTNEEALGSVNNFLADLEIEHAYHDISAKDWQQFKTRAARQPMAYVRRATADDAKKYPVQEGEAVFDTDLITQDVTEFVSGLRSSRAAAERQVKLAADNSRRTAPQVETPPAVSTAKAPPAKKPPGFTSKSDVEAWLDDSTAL